MSASKLHQRKALKKALRQKRANGAKPVQKFQPKKVVRPAQKPTPTPHTPIPHTPIPHTPAPVTFNPNCNCEECRRIAVMQGVDTIVSCRNTCGNVCGVPCNTQCGNVPMCGGPYPFIGPVGPVAPMGGCGAPCGGGCAAPMGGCAAPMTNTTIYYDELGYPVYPVSIATSTNIPFGYRAYGGITRSLVPNIPYPVGYGSPNGAPAWHGSPEGAPPLAPPMMQSQPFCNISDYN